LNWLKAILASRKPVEPTTTAVSGQLDSREPSPVDAYRLTPPRSSQAIGRWAKAFPDYPEIVGYSYLGYFFLRDPESNDYIVLHPFKWAAKSYGSHASVEDFEREVLKEPGFSQFVLRSDHVAAIHRRLGDPGEDEIYIPEPYPFLGGTEAPDTYIRGNVWIFMDIVAQMGGLED
jgi:hypothetical protein